MSSEFRRWCAASLFLINVSIGIRRSRALGPVAVILMDGHGQAALSDVEYRGESAPVVDYGTRRDLQIARNPDSRPRKHSDDRTQTSVLRALAENIMSCRVR